MNELLSHESVRDLFLASPAAANAQNLLRQQILAQYQVHDTKSYSWFIKFAFF